jgi:hypothetical protein
LKEAGSNVQQRQARHSGQEATDYDDSSHGVDYDREEQMLPTI